MLYIFRKENEMKQTFSRQVFTGARTLRVPFYYLCILKKMYMQYR
jgi:hypothetical protein